MNRDTWLWGLGIGALVLLAGAGGVAVVEAMWKQQGAGPQWLPALNAAEARYGIPADLLARMAYQESHFRPDIISGATASSVGALGLMQLRPQFFSSVRVPIPFAPADTLAQIDEAARELQRLYRVFNDWQLAVAAYNWGQGNLQAWLAKGGSSSLPTETANYVSEVLTDVNV